MIDIITITICAVVCGANSWQHIEEFGQAKLDWFKDFLQLPHGIPSHNTFARVFAQFDPDKFQHSFMSWVCAICQLSYERHDNVELFFQDYLNSATKQPAFDFYQSTDGGYGRIEIRKYWTTSDIKSDQ